MEKDSQWNTKSSEMDILCTTSRKESYCNLVYFILNLLAFLGYGLSIFCYYFPKTEDYAVLKFYLESGDADWYGNFIGDFCWTVEPIILTFSPLWIYSKKAKAKVD